jgi:hypothetical protein
MHSPLQVEYPGNVSHAEHSPSMHSGRPLGQFLQVLQVFLLTLLGTHCPLQVTLPGQISSQVRQSPSKHNGLSALHEWPHLPQFCES